jgi:hypothetical protein
VSSFLERRLYMFCNFLGKMKIRIEKAIKLKVDYFFS